MNGVLAQLTPGSKQYFQSILSLLTAVNNTDIDIFKYIDNIEGKDQLVETLCDLDFWKNFGSGQIKFLFPLNAKFSPEQFYSKITQLIIHENNRYYLLHRFCDVFEAANRIATISYPSYVDYLNDNLEEKTLLAKLMLKNIGMFTDYEYSIFERIKHFSYLVPNADDVLLKRLESEIKPAEKLGEFDDWQMNKWHACLGDLVQLYGLDIIVAKCQELNLGNQASYLEDKFKNYPQILTQTHIISKWFKVFLDPEERVFDSTNKIQWKHIHKLSEQIEKVLLKFSAIEGTPECLTLNKTSEIFSEICKKAEVQMQDVWDVLPSHYRNLDIKVHASGEVSINDIPICDQRGNHLSRTGIKFADKYLFSKTDMYEDQLSGIKKEFEKLDVNSQKLLQSKYQMLGDHLPEKQCNVTVSTPTNPNSFFGTNKVASLDEQDTLIAENEKTNKFCIVS